MKSPPIHLIRDAAKTLRRLLTGNPPEPDTDWAAVIGLARRHGVAPFLYHVLHPHRDRLPPEAYQALQALYHQAVARFLLRKRQLGEVLKALHSAHVPVVLLKGAAVAHAAYPDPALRTMGDLDLWIPRQRLAEAQAALFALGYTVRSKAERPQPLHAAYLGETQMVHTDSTRGLVELHWKVFPGEWLRLAAHIDEAPLWERSIPLEGIAARRLPPEDMVLNACLHLAITHQMGGGGIRTFLDLHLLQSRFALDWDLIVQRARAWRVQTALWLVLDRWAGAFGHPANIPLPLLQPAPLRQEILRRLVPLTMLWADRSFDQGWQRRIFLLLLVDRPRDAVRLLRRALFPERRWLVLLYGLEEAPAWRVLMQQVAHPLRVLGRGDV